MNSCANALITLNTVEKYVKQTLQAKLHLKKRENEIMLGTTLDKPILVHRDYILPNTETYRSLLVVDIVFRGNPQQFRN